MAYNSGFPIGYNYLQPQYTYAPQAVQANQSGVIWVQGEAGAKSYMVAPNNTVILMDSESPCFYLKSADASGMPTLRAFDFTERSLKTDTPQIPQSPAYVTKEEFEEFKKSILEKGETNG